MPTAPPTTADHTARPHRATLHAALRALAIFVALAVVHLWPLASAPGTLSRNDNGDTILHEWIMAWVAHQVVANPLHLFDANIFYPERGTLAYSDHLFVQSMLGAPLLWAGASPVLVHNLVLMAGFALTGWTTSLVMRKWTGSWLAAIGSGSLVAFNSFSLTRLPQIQDLHLEFFPLALLALDRLLGSPRLRHALSLAGWFVLQSLTGTYVMVFTSLSLVAAALARPSDWLGPRFRGVAVHLLTAVVAAVAVLTAVPAAVLPRERRGRPRTIARGDAALLGRTDRLLRGGRPHPLRRHQVEPAVFPGRRALSGILALALALVGVPTTGVRDVRTRMLRRDRLLCRSRCRSGRRSRLTGSSMRSTRC